MTVKNIVRNLSLLAVVTLVPVSLVAGNPDQPQTAMEKEGIQLIHQLEDVARDLRHHTGRLQSISKDMNVSRYTHIHHLIQVRELVNDGLRPALARLSELQPQLPEWKQESINAMLDAARALSADANEAIISKNETRTIPPAMNAPYKELIARIHDHAESLVKTSDAAGTYASARWKAKEAGLSVATN